MGQILHANARTTEAIRQEIRISQESLIKEAEKSWRCLDGKTQL